MAKAIFLPFYPDFQTYYNTAQGFLQGKDMYSIASPFSATFVYPPFALIFMLPFAFLPATVSGNIWSFFSFTAFILSIFLLLKIEDEKLFSNRFLMFFTFAFLSFPAKFTLGMGQINMFILLFLVAFLYFYKNNKTNTASALFGLSLATKLFPILFPLVLIMKGKVKLLFTIMLATFLFFLVSIFIFSPNSFIYYWHAIFPTVAHAIRTDYYNQALSGFVYDIFGKTPFSQSAILLLSLFIISISLFIIWKKNVSLPILFGFTIVIQIIINTFSEQHHLVWLLIPYVQTTYILLKHHAKKLLYTPLGVSFILSQSNIPHPQSVPAIFLPHAFYGTLILWVFILYLIAYDKRFVSH